MDWDWDWGKAQVKGAVPAASAVAEICFRKSRLEFMCRTSGAEAQALSALRGAEAPLFHGRAGIASSDPPTFLALAAGRGAPTTAAGTAALLHYTSRLCR